MREIDPGVWSLPVEGLHLKPGSLGDQLEADPQLLVFLRHLG